MRPRQARLSRLMMATAAVAVALAALRAMGNDGTVAIVLFLFLVPIPLFGWFMVRWSLPFVHRMRTAPEDRDSRWHWSLETEANRGDWALATFLTLLVVGLIYYPALIGMLSAVLGPGWMD